MYSWETMQHCESAKQHSGSGPEHIVMQTSTCMLSGGNMCLSPLLAGQQEKLTLVLLWREYSDKLFHVCIMSAAI